MCSSIQWNVQLLCYIGAKYHILITRKLNLFLQKSIKLLPPFGPDMHQIVCRLGLRPRPHWGSSQRSPRHPSWIKGAYTSKGRGGKGNGLWTLTMLETDWRPWARWLFLQIFGRMIFDGVWSGDRRGPRGLFRIIRWPVFRFDYQ